MDKTAIDDVDIERNPMEVHSVRRPISQALGFTDFAMNYTVGCNCSWVRRSARVNPLH